MSAPSVSGASLALGEFEISRIQAGTYWWDGGAIFGVVPKTLWSRKTSADDLNRVGLAFNCYLIRTRKHTILVETGGGDKLESRARERMNLPAEAEPLPEVVARSGFDPEAIDIVINSHLHWDHCGGNTILTGGGAVAAFPRARYFAPRGEWEHAHERLARDSVSYIDSNYDPLVESGQMTLVEGDCEVVPGVRMCPAPGHNRDMMVVVATSGGQTFCFLSDLVPTAAHAQPTWVASFDLYPLETIENKVRWLSAAADGGWACGFAHDVENAFTRIVRDPKVQFRTDLLGRDGPR
ncbi:MAG TPA: MBL fold metallo-hydrolase [Bryobacteraceae bacterium]